MPYRKIDTRIWNDERFRLMDAHERLLWFALLTHPSITPMGAGVLDEYALDSCLGADIGTSKSILDKFEKDGLILRDGDLIVVKNYLIYNSPDNPSILAGWIESCEALPRSQVFKHLYEHLCEHPLPEWLLHGLIKPLADQKTKWLKHKYWDRVDDFCKKAGKKKAPKTPKKTRSKTGAQTGVQTQNKQKPNIKQTGPEQQEQEQEQEQEVLTECNLKGFREGIADRLQDEKAPPSENLKTAQSEISDIAYSSRAGPKALNPNPPALDLGLGTIHSGSGISTNPSSANTRTTPLHPSARFEISDPPPNPDFEAGAPFDCTGLRPDKRPVGAEHDQIMALQALHSQIWKIPQPTGLPSADNKQRVLSALRSSRFGFNGCQAAIYGHHKLASKDGSQLGRWFRSVFPEARFGNKRHSCKLDEDRFEEFMVAGMKLVPNEKKARQRDDFKRALDDKAMNETKKDAELVGIEKGDDLRTMFKKFKNKGKE